MVSIKKKCDDFVYESCRYCVNYYKTVANPEQIEYNTNVVKTTADVVELADTPDLGGVLRSKPPNPA